MTEERIQEFWNRIHKEPGFNGCWLWVGTKTTGGYATFWADGELHYAHRLVFKLVTGKDPECDACHHCDTPNCIRPDHLFDGTPKQNTQDMIRKGRARGARGTSNHRARVNEDLVRKIRERVALGETSSQIANDLQLSWQTVYSIVTFKSWKWVLPKRMRTPEDS